MIRATETPLLEFTPERQASVENADPATADAAGLVRIPAQRAAPAAGLDHTLAAVLAEVAHLDEVPLGSNFFTDLGADSLVMAHFCARIRKRPDLPQVSMKDIYQQPTIAGLATALAGSAGNAGGTRASVAPAGGSVATVAPPAPAPSPESAPPEIEAPRRAGTAQFVFCGALQFLIFLGYSFLVAEIITRGNEWIFIGRGMLEIYLRAVLVGGGSFAVVCVLPILVKWVLVGRWKPREIRIWSLGYLRFWIVKTLVRANPLILFAGSPLYSLYLRALGAKVGRGVAVFSRNAPICTDLLTIGDGSVVCQDSFFTGYRAHAGSIQIGAVTLGENVFVAEATVLDINTSIGDDAQLGRSSSLHSGQAVPAGERWHGSPAQRTQVDYRAGHSAGRSRWRTISYSAGQLLTLLFVYLPLGFGGITLLLAQVPQLTSLLGSGPLAMSTWAFYRDALIASAALLFGAVILGLFLVFTVPRLLNLMLVPDRVYPLYGFHYGIQRTIVRMTNVKLFTRIFGDSSFITGYLRRLGYDLCDVQQTGSNFGTEVRQEIPYLSSVGSATMVADGLSIINSDFSSTSFRVSRVSIGPRNFLGNRIAYPARGRTGDNCLLATKVMIPIEGTVREGVGLLGSPSFEIPRTVDRDSRVDELKSADELRRGLAAKNRHNVATIGLFLLTRWGYLFGLLLLTGVALDLYDTFGPAAIALDIALTPFFTVLYFVLVERLLTALHRLRPLYCSIYDRDFWFRERYWKVPAELYLQAFNGTPFKNLVWRLLGVRLGRRVFDDGCYLTERSLCTIGDDCTLNAGSVIQCHSQEDGAFKSDASALGARCTIGVGAFVHYGVTIGDDAVLAPDSFLMKGEQVPEHARWGGNPARTMSEHGRPVRTTVIPGPAPDLRLVAPGSGSRRSLTLWSRPAGAALVLAGLALLVWTPQLAPAIVTELPVQLTALAAAFHSGDTALAYEAGRQAVVLLLPLLGVAATALVIGMVAARRLHPAPPVPERTGPGWPLKTPNLDECEPAIQRFVPRALPSPRRPVETRPATASAAPEATAGDSTPVPPPATTPPRPTPRPRVPSSTPAPPPTTTTPRPTPRPRVPSSTPVPPPAAALPPPDTRPPEPVPAPVAPGRAGDHTPTPIRPVVGEPPARTKVAAIDVAATVPAPRSPAVVERLTPPALPTMLVAAGRTAIPGAFLLAATLTVLVGWLTATGLDRRLTTAGEALLAAGAAFHPGSVLAPLSWPDTVAAPQIAVLEVLLSGFGQQSVTGGARTALLLVSVLGCLVLAVVARRLMLSAPGAAVAVALCGLPVPLIAELYGSIDAGALAAFWLTVAAAAAGRSRGASWAALAATAVAVLTVPLAAVGPLALATHCALGGSSGPGRRRAMTALGIGLAVLTGVIAARSTGLWSLGVGAWAGSGRGALPTPLLVGMLAVGAASLIMAWFFALGLRPVVTAGATMLACAAVPGPHVTSALLLAVPVLALLVATAAEELAVRVRLPRSAVLAAVLVVSVVSAGPLVATASTPGADRSGLTGWIEAQLDPTTVLRVDPLTGAQLIRDGIPAERLVPATEQAPPGALSVVAVRPGGATLPTPAGSLVLVTVPDGPGGGSTSVVGPAPGPDDAAERARLEPRLAGNPGLVLAPPAADVLRAGMVDLRLATALSGLTVAHRVTVAEFAAVPGEPADALRRTAVITEVDGASTAAPGATDLVQYWLNAQVPPYRPATTGVQGGVLVVGYAIPSAPGPTDR